MSESQVRPEVQRAVSYFREAGLTRLLERLRERYIQLGRVGGLVILEQSTSGERREIASFLGQRTSNEDTLRVRLADVEAALLRSRFACTLPELLSAFFSRQPLVTRPEQRSARAKRQEEFRAALAASATGRPADARGRLWLEQGVHGHEWLFTRFKNESEKEQAAQLDLIRYVADTLDQLPPVGSHERLGLFAQRTSGDPHTLDSDRAAGRLFLLALGDLARDQTLSIPYNATAAQRLYASVGLLVDTISSSVAVFNLAGAAFTDGTVDPLPRAAGERVLLLPLRQMLAWQSAQPASRAIYAFENPQVFEEVIAGLMLHRTATADARKAGVLPTLVCTSGWPSTAALTLLDLLMAWADANYLYYSGDFDPSGLQIAATLWTHYPDRFQLWHFAPEDYLAAVHTEGNVVTATELSALNVLPDMFRPLVTTMQEQGKWAYQEGITHLLLEDVKASSKI